jgi:hypothetical protein
MSLMPYRKRSLQALMAITHLDAPAAAVFSRQLEDIDTQVYNYNFPDLIAEQLLGTRTIAPGKSIVTWRGFSRAGMAKVIADYSDDIPRVDILGEENFAKVRRIADAWGTNIDEIDLSRNGDALDIEAEKAVTAREVIQQKLERIAAIGDEDYGLTGIANQANALEVTIPSGAGGGAGTEWDSGKTPEEILADLNAMAAESVSLTRGKDVPNTLLLPPAQRGYIATTRMGDGSDTTILNFFLATNGRIQSVVEWEQLTGAGASGADRMVAFRRDPRYVQLLVDALRTLDPQPRNMEIVHILTRRTAGVISRFPLSTVFADGI